VTEALRREVRLPPQRRCKLLLAARHPDRARTIAKVPPQLTVDRRCGVGGEGDAARRVEAPSRRDKGERPHLQKIVQRLSATRVASGEPPDERQVTADQIRRTIHSAQETSIFLFVCRKFK
jgi:hypothetical protein